MAYPVVPVAGPPRDTDPPVVGAAPRWPPLGAPHEPAIRASKSLRCDCIAGLKADALALCVRRSTRLLGESSGPANHHAQRITT